MVGGSSFTQSWNTHSEAELDMQEVTENLDSLPDPNILFTVSEDVIAECSACDSLALQGDYW